MKKTKVIIILFMLVLIGGVMAETTMNPLTKGHADTLYCPFGGCNYTGNVYAQDWLLWNGSSCCLGGTTGISSITATSPIVSSGGTTPVISWNPINIALGFGNLTDVPQLGNTTTEIRSLFGNSSNITYDASTGSFSYNGSIGGGVGGASPFTDVDNIYIYNATGTITFNETKLNITTNASIDLRVDVSYLQNLLDSIYATISIVQNWINTNSTADRAYTDTRVDSINNHTPTVNTFNSTDDIWKAIDNQTWDERIDSINNISNSSILDLTSVYNDTSNILWENSTGEVRLKSPQNVQIASNLTSSVNTSGMEFKQGGGIKFWLYS